MIFISSYNSTNRPLVEPHRLVAPIDDSDRNQNTVLGFPGKSYTRFICLFVSKCLQFYFYSGHTDRQTLSFIYIDVIDKMEWGLGVLQFHRTGTIHEQPLHLEPSVFDGCF